MRDIVKNMVILLSTVLWFPKSLFVFVPNRNQQHNKIKAMQVRQKELERKARRFQRILDTSVVQMFSK